MCSMPPATTMAIQVRAGSRCPSTNREASAVNSGAMAIVTSTLATVVSVIATMKAVYITHQHRPDTQSGRPPVRSVRHSRAGPWIQPSSSSSASELNRLRQKVSSKPLALSR